MENRAPGTPPRGPRRRDRRGRGMRGPGVLPRTPGRPETRTARERFDDLVLAVVTEVDARWADRLGVVEYAVEDTPDLPDDWDPTTVPLGSAVRGTGGAPSRVVVFRRPIEHRAETRSDLDAIVLTVVVEQVADLLNVDPQVIDPRYDAD
ncbi:metallopeptidase family protein [Nocardioides marmotae]|uniref:metallopeptidase family protein n=1 Tax=Nocardioides marmotae TaxID=2663857 RepID=UPI001E478753|nr:metallopeptidase family protein [Nocardioides marmotae]